MKMSVNFTHKPSVCAALAGVLCMLFACTRTSSRDTDFAGLIQAKPTDNVSVDVEQASRDIQSAIVALAMPHSQVGHLIGSHRFRGTSRVEVYRGSELIESLKDETTIDYHSDENFRATLENDQDYGRHAIFSNGKLYLRPRYGRYHERAPAQPAEPANIRDEIYSTVRAYTQPLSNSAEPRDQGTSTFASRPVRKIQLQLATRGNAPTEDLEHRKWRESIVVSKVEGTLQLDTETGVPLQASIRGAFTFERDGKPLQMRVRAEHALSDLGKVEPVSPPPAANTVQTPTQPSEVEERRQLLKGISSPARPTSAPPSAGR